MRFLSLSALIGLIMLAVPAIAQEGESNSRGIDISDPEGQITDSQDANQNIQDIPSTGASDQGQNYGRSNQPLPPPDFDGPTPFANDLFNAPIDPNISLNPDSIVKPGDQIHVTLYGGKSFEGVLKVDLQGNIFLPEVGPIPVDGIRNAELQPRIESFVRRVFTERVKVYTNLLSTQPIGVFVTGYVNQPGQYSGDRTDSVLYYLLRARGIDAWRGSFRSVRIIRRGRTLSTIDMYQAKMNGNMPFVQMETGDRIVVDPIGNVFTALGKVRNENRFEFRSPYITGAQAIRLARPTPRASHVSVRGIRNRQPFNTYVSLKRFATMRVYDGDRVRFTSDHPNGSFFVHVVGQKAGPSTFSINAGTTLKHVLNMVEVDPHTAALNAIYIRRTSVARRQQAALNSALNELEEAVLTAESESTKEVSIRVQEAQMVERFVKRARNTKLEGRVVISNSPLGRDIHMEPDDIIVIPKQTTVISVGGEVLMPQNVVYLDGASVRYYIKQAGGMTERANGGNPVVLRLDGSIATGHDTRVLPGDEIRILAAPDPKLLARFKDLVEVVYRIALSSAALVRAF